MRANPSDFPASPPVTADAGIEASQTRPLVDRESMDGAPLRISVAFGAFFLCLARPSIWRPPVIDRIARQIFFAGIELVPLFVIAGAGTGLLAAFLGRVWLDYTELNDVLTTMMGTMLVREAAPLLGVLVCAAANSGPITAELALMKVKGEVALLRALGVCEFSYLVFPRMLGLATATTCGAIVVSTSALTVAGLGLGEQLDGIGPAAVILRILSDLNSSDVVLLVLKAATGGLLLGAVACVTGLSAGSAGTEVARLVSKVMKTALLAVAALWGVFGLVGVFL